MSRRKEVEETPNWSPLKTCILLEPTNERLSLAPPLWMDLESTQDGKPPGEATLKRDLAYV